MNVRGSGKASTQWDSEPAISLSLKSRLSFFCHVHNTGLEPGGKTSLQCKPGILNHETDTLGWRTKDATVTDVADTEAAAAAAASAAD